MPRHHGLFRFFVLALTVPFLLVPRLASAQFDAATVLGTVADATGGVVPGATVTLKNAETGITAMTVSDGEGRYQFLNVRIGVYSLRAELQGFSAAIADKSGDRQRPSACRPDDEGRRRRRNGRGHGRGAFARERIERSRTGHRPRADRQPAIERPRLRRPCAPQPRRSQVVDLGVARRARSMSTGSAARSTTSSSTASTTTPTARAIRASRIRSSRCRPMPSRSSRSRPTTSAPSTAAPAALSSTRRSAAARTSSAAPRGSSTATRR